MVTIISREDKRILVLHNLENVCRHGIPLYMDGLPASPETIADYCVRENDDVTYMPDYVMDETGHLKEVRYDRIMQSSKV